MTDTIDSDVLERAALVVHKASHGLPIIHTVTITLNGQHGGADVRIAGFTSDQLDETLVVEATV